MTSPALAESRPKLSLLLSVLVVGVLALFVVGVIVAAVLVVERVEGDVHHAERLYSMIGLRRSSLGNVEVFWGGYAAYAAACLFLFAWLGKFPIVKGLGESLIVALLAVASVFLPFLFFIISIRIPAAGRGLSSVSCGSWLYPASSAPARCVKEYAIASRYGIVCAACGILVPLGCMLYSVCKHELWPQLSEAGVAARQDKEEPEHPAEA